LSYELRGVRALNVQDWQGAAVLFRKGIALAPPDSAMRRSLHHKLGTALWMLNDERGAVAEYETVVRLAPAGGIDEPTAKAHYSLGIVLASRGRAAQAIEHLTTALRYQPGYAEAHIALGDLLRGSGRFAEALPHFEAVTRIDPRSIPGRIGYAITLVRLGRDLEAREWLAESIRLQPDQPDLAQALARVLAAAPDDRARDGERALEIAQQLSATEKTGAVAETLAMALAEVGHYRDAVTVQRGALDAARRAGLTPAVARMTANLRLYEQDRPCRMPWRDEP
jgi:tetratricopeptide (TPR) repeat protein